jgi:hypothetical protein
VPCRSAIGTLYKKAVPIDEQLEAELSKLLVEQFGAVPKKSGGSAQGGGKRAAIGNFFSKLFAGAK